MSNLFQHCTPAQMDRDSFVSTFADIYEHSPWVAEQTYDQGPVNEFNDINKLQQRMATVLLSASQPTQLALINAHPDLAGKAAVAGELTEASTAEQAGAGISECTAAEFQRFTELNNAYKARFNFPFIMAVKGSNRHQILAAFESRIYNSPEDEFARALDEINRIAMFRLSAM